MWTLRPVCDTFELGPFGTGHAPRALGLEDERPWDLALKREEPWAHGPLAWNKSGPGPRVHGPLTSNTIGPGPMRLDLDTKCPGPMGSGPMGLLSPGAL